MVQPLSWRLKKYTEIHPEEVLMIELKTSSGEEDIVVIYNGFSSSLVKPTTYDPDIPVIEPDAEIITIDRIASPYNPAQPQYIEQGLSSSAMEQLLHKSNL